MLTLKSVLISAALSLPPPWYPPGENPETQTEYESRIERIAEAVAEETAQVRGWTWGRRALAMAVLTVMYNESRFAVAVHTGEQLGDRGRASCLGQIHVSGMVPREEWEKLTGDDIESTRRCARATIRMLVAHYRGCGLHKRGASVDGVARMFAAYGSGNSCTPTRSALSRAAFWNRLMKR